MNTDSRTIIPRVGDRVMFWAPDFESTGRIVATGFLGAVVQIRPDEPDHPEPIEAGRGTFAIITPAIEALCDPAAWAAS